MGRAAAGSLLRATAPGVADIDAYEMDLCARGATARLVLNAHKLDYADADNVRLCWRWRTSPTRGLPRSSRTIWSARRQILLQELQHRVANSLQIIASVLMQSARRVQSDETRTHLHDAHHRVMSIATMQKQLAASRLGEVELRAYFTDLCASIGASMIADRDQLSLTSTADDSAVTGGRLGQPRPDRHRTGDQRPQARLSRTHRPGRIVVDYRARTAPAGPSRSATTAIGMPADGPVEARPRHQHRRGAVQAVGRPRQPHRRGAGNEGLDRPRLTGHAMRQAPGISLRDTGGGNGWLAAVRKSG